MDRHSISSNAFTPPSAEYMIWSFCWFFLLRIPLKLKNAIADEISGLVENRFVGVCVCVCECCWLNELNSMNEKECAKQLNHMHVMFPSA